MKDRFRIKQSYRSRQLANWLTQKDMKRET